MGIASSMRNLAQNIVSSHDDRTKTVAKMKEETSQTREEARDLIKGFQDSRKELKVELKEASAAWQELTGSKSKVRRTPKWESQQE